MCLFFKNKVTLQVKTFFTLTTFLFLIFFYQNCSKYNSNMTYTKSQSSSSCKVQPHLSTPFEQGKIQIDNSLLDGGQVSQSASGEIQNKATTPKNIDLSLVVDPLCMSRSETPISLLGQTVTVPSELSDLDRAAISLTFTTAEIDLDQLENDMEQSPCLIGISEDGIVALEQTSSQQPSTASFNDPKAGEQAHLDFVNHPDSLDLQNQITASVVVAVVDTGIDQDHPDLVDQLWDDGSGNHGESFIPSEPSIEDFNRHGTHVSGIIAAKQNNTTGIIGLNGDFVKIMTVKALGRSGQGTLTGIYNGMQYAIRRGADVMNLSLGTGSTNSVILDQGVMEAVNKGLVVVMAAGNKGMEILLSNSQCPSPACVSRAVNGSMTVGSVDTSSGNLSSFSNYSTNFVEISAPGSENYSSKLGLLSTLLNGQYGRLSGTSMASPVVAGAAAFPYWLF